MTRSWKKDLKTNNNVKVNGQFLESKGSNGICFIDLPLNSNQAATLFAWKLKILKIGSRKEHYAERVGDHQQRTTIKFENEIKLGISSRQEDVLLSNKSDVVVGAGTSFKLTLEKIKFTMKQADIFSFQFDCTTGTLFVQKNDENRILLGYANNLESIRTCPFYPSVKFESKGDKVEILSASPVHNLIYSRPTAISGSYLNIFQTPEPAPVLCMLLAVCITCYSIYRYKK